MNKALKESARNFIGRFTRRKGSVDVAKPVEKGLFLRIVGWMMAACHQPRGGAHGWLMRYQPGSTANVSLCVAKEPSAIADLSACVADQPSASGRLVGWRICRPEWRTSQVHRRISRRTWRTSQALLADLSAGGLVGLCGGPAKCAGGFVGLCGGPDRLAGGRASTTGVRR